MKGELQQRLIDRNPVLVDFIGLCPVLAVTNTVYNAVGMSLGTSVVLLFSSLVVSILRQLIPHEVRMPSYIIIIASLVSVVDMLMEAYTPVLSRELGAFISLIVVNCLILGQVESHASKNPPIASLWHSFCTAVGFSFGLILVAACRELLGSASITIANPNLWSEAVTWLGLLTFHRGKILTPLSYAQGGSPLTLLTMPAGALFVVGYLGAFFSWLQRHKTKA